MSSPLSQHLEFAIETAYEAGRLTLGYFQTRLRPDFKTDETPVTVADQRAEQLIRQRLSARYPDHVIVGEELGGRSLDKAMPHWYIDPIDGTRAFVRGVPMYAVLLGLTVDDIVQVGVAYFPALDEMLAAARGQGCWWNGRPARVSTIERLQDGLIVHADTASFAHYGRGPAWRRLQAAAGFRAGWSDAYGYLLVATGRAELMLDPIMNVWDCAPFPVILEEAGGYFGDWQGNVTIQAGEALATTPVLLPQVLELIGGDSG
ncbi:MAG: inositol monophosphatase family protein [Candidatus Promineifilaceae bacterium]|nr:inositol monophosphatase family protein [Candidatus Promineifilaceae bacterium]